MAHEVFISHASHDKLAADAMCARLEEQQLRCWIAPRDILPGTSYGAAIVGAIAEAKVMVVILSKQANISRHVIKEVERAVSKGIPVIPFRIEEVLPIKDLEYFLSTEHWLDAVVPPLEAHLQKLGCSVKALLSVERSFQAKESKEDRRRVERQFEEAAPDEWRHSRRSLLGNFFRKLFEERL